MPVTIRDVAEAAGVSITTVSRALNGYADVSPETRKRILQIAERLNYRPNHVARSLVRQRTQTIGLLVSDFGKSRTGHHFMFDVLAGVYERLAELGYDVSLVSTTTAQQHLVSYLDFCTERRFEGVIVMGIRLDDPYVHEVVESPLPSVVIDLPLLSDHCGYVMTDNINGAKFAVRHLFQQGHRHIGFVNGYAQAAVSADRLRGYKEGLRTVGLPFEPALVYESDFSLAGGAQGFRELRQGYPDVTAIFFASDLMAIGGMREALANGLRVPEDLAVVGFDNIDLTELVSPTLTTVGQHRYEMGMTAAEMLIGMLERDEPPQGRLLAPELIVRESG
ncbi:LacI family DNA-binding transcriptional regulator [Alicyclobacillus kakegawensis]|uniref:LacI family DNA-binding transcriptional regulator n=1 Tax=Alicyclobacillus kakegawensis TaxID=392012 RepID=UPI00082C17AF|nr:LacI family DNA-binding transcriptional regulator [Alicyclobacillus kakegawensis]